ncbi:MAG: trigger factor [Actinobacteria bacterium]|nr:trigger factor [Actinomycetota bacterium]MBV8396541.1 trigger factor [Actinomycetota bacterium]
MPAQVEQLAGDRVRLTVEVPAEDVHHAVQHATSDLAARVKVPGFRVGKVPAKVLVQRIGKERVYEEAVESHIGGWFWNAAAETRIQPTEQPRYEYELPQSDDAAWRFTAEFPVQPKPEPADWTTLEVPRLEIELPAEAVDAQLEALQRTVAEVVAADGRPAQEGDVAIVDLVSDGEAQRDLVVEVGAGRLLEEIEAAIVGLGAGESRDVQYELADGSRHPVSVTVKELREKVLPPLDDDLARAASEFDTLDELRGDIERRIREQLDEEIDRRFRAAAVDELVRATDVKPGRLVVEARTRELVNGFVHSLQSRGIDVRSYFQLTGQSPEELERRLRGEAVLSIARELVLEAVADKLGLEVTDAEIRADLLEAGEEEADIDDFFAEGGADRVRESLRMRKALDRIAAEVKPISAEQAAERAQQEAARASIWTPGQENPGAEKTLWTPSGRSNP